MTTQDTSLSERTKRRWTQDEIARLNTAVEHSKNGSRISWNKVAAEVSTRTANQCKTYFSLVLKSHPPTNHSWTQQEVDHLVYLVKYFGTQWNLISLRYFPWCSPDKLRSKFAAIKKKKMELQILVRDTMKAGRVIDEEGTKLAIKHMQNLKQEIQDIEKEKNASDNLSETQAPPIKAEPYMEHILERNEIDSIVIYLEALLQGTAMSETTNIPSESDKQPLPAIEIHK